ncbi:excitatory amino acid transporter 1 isoform X6 [Scophthalmus maximus]|uniref:excitatory amino acid transporter 1 isoform X6 n=1 Tax=Scophthalmus maximus TaxID=52904 RepID=UPI001FA82199|nr:excitatory amino acid transporter 1 isoform X6 [Scophthalmus maximus]
MHPSARDLSDPESGSVKVTEPQETQTHRRWDQPSGPVFSSPNGSKIVGFVKRNTLFVLTIAAVALGIGLGFALRHVDMSARNVRYLTFPGELLMRVLQMVSLPLIISSLIAGMSSVDRKGFGRIGLRAFSYYTVTTLIAAFTGIALASVIQPGTSSRNPPTPSGGKVEAVQSVDAFLDLIRYSPVGIIFLLAGQIVKMADTGEIGREVAMYALTVIAGLLIHSFLTLPLVYVVVTRSNPFRFMGGLLQALATAFGTSSSSATLPVTLHCMEVNHNMDKQVTRFMLPTGATMNMDGAALYEAVAALFIAQLHNMDFDLGQIIVLSLIVTAASTGAAGIPQAGMVSMVIVLSSAGLPTEDISLLMIVDWILDRLRTATNVLGDCIGVGVVQHLSRQELRSPGPAEESLVEESLRL